jgi:hypothetical protein
METPAKIECITVLLVKTGIHAMTMFIIGNIISTTTTSHTILIIPW